MSTHRSSSHHHHRKHRQSSLPKESIVIDTSLGNAPKIVIKKAGEKKVRKHKAKKSTVRKIESFITKYLFLSLGIIFLIGSIWWLYDTNLSTGGSFWNKLMNFLFPVSNAGLNVETSEITNPFEWKIYLPYLFSFLLLGFTFVLDKKNHKTSVLLVYLGSISLFVINFKILYYNGLYLQNFCYPNIFIAILLALILVLSTAISSIYLKTPKLNIISIPSFYLALFFIIGYYGVKIYYLMSSVLIMTVLVYFLSLKQHLKQLNLWNFIFAWFFIIMIWLRKIVAFNTSNYLFSFILFSTIFYVLSQLFIVLDYHKNHSRKHRLKDIIILSFNLGLYILMGVFAIRKFGFQNYEFLFSLSTVLINVAFLYFIVRKNLKTNLTYFYYVTILLISLTFALIFNNNFLIIFTAVSSVTFLLYSKKTRDQISILVSLGLAGVMFLVFLFNWIFIYIPSTFSGSIISDKEMLINGLISGLFVLPLLFANNQILKKIYISFSDEWFNRNNIRIYIRLFYVFSLYLVLFFAFQYIFLSITKTLLLNLLSWYIFNCIFLIILIYLAGRKVRTVFIISILIFAAISILLYPFAVHYSIREIRDAFLTNHELFISGFGLHYVAVFLSFYLLFVINHRIKRKFSGNKIIFRSYYIFTSLITIYFILSEYDHFTFIQAFRKGELTQQLAHTNSHLPYSILLIVTSLIIIAIAFIKRFRFVRFIGFTVFSITLIKILVFDIEMLSNTSKVIVSFLLGAVLIVISLNYSKVKKIFLSKK